MWTDDKMELLLNITPEYKVLTWLLAKFTVPSVVQIILFHFHLEESYLV